jgi:hypothetical protein
MDGDKKVQRPHGDVAEEDPERQRAPVDEDDGNQKAPRRSKRVASLDVFRGLTVAVSGFRSLRLLFKAACLIAAKLKLVIGVTRLLKFLTIASQKLSNG